ncbi:MAG: acetyl esterase [Propionibacteriaceae bacterium]|nr:acetyl esterase [Propionibacteriaceae bacterium]
MSADSNKLPVHELMSQAMKDVVDKSNELSPDAYVTDDGFEAMRAAYNLERRYWNEGGPTMRLTVDAAVTTPMGQVPVRFHIPWAQSPAPAIIYVHGGGFVLGNLDTHDRIMRTLAADTGATVIGVDYSLSPEAKFPVALYQCATVAHHLHDEGEKYGVDGTRLAFAGDSGGAMLSLATYLYLRDTGDASYIDALLLYYGLFGLRDSPSRRLFGGPWDGLTEADLDYYMSCYLERPEDARSPYVDCLSADLDGLPPCFVAAAELDPLRDDSEALATMLGKHGVAHQHIVYPGVLHGFLHNSRHLDTAVDALREGSAFFTDVINNLPLTTSPTHLLTIS